MWYEFANKVYTPDAGASVANNTDWSISGTSKKFAFTSIDDEVVLTFTQVDVTSFDEISMQLYTTPNVNGNTDVLEIEIDGEVYSFDEMSKEFHHILFDTTGLNDLTEIIFRAKVDNLVVFLDLLGYRKTNYGQNIEDVLSSIANKITIDYNVSTTLNANLSTGATKISVANSQYMRQNTMILIDNTEYAVLTDNNLNLQKPITGSFSSGDAVKIIVPIKWGDNKTINNDPVCGVLMYDLANRRKEYVNQYMQQGYVKKKVFLNEIYIIIYLECHSKKKLFEMIEKYEFNYGEQFNFILDGEKVELISVDSGTLLPDMIGNYPRMSYRYSFKPQPLLIERRKQIDDMTLNLSIGVS